MKNSLAAQLHHDQEIARRHAAVVVANVGDVRIHGSRELSPGLCHDIVFPKARALVNDLSPISRSMSEPNNATNKPTNISLIVRSGIELGMEDDLLLSRWKWHR